MEIKTYSTSIDFEFDEYITCYMARQLKLYILANPYIDDVLSIKFLQSSKAFEKRVALITILHHAKDDETINTILNKLFTDFIANAFLFMKSNRML